jgi:hypothetical protein
LPLILPLPRKTVGADVAEGCLHRVGLRGIAAAITRLTTILATGTVRIPLSGVLRAAG